MAPKSKRSAEDSNEVNERATKIARTAKNGGSSPKSKNSTKKAPAKAALSTADFTAKALPLHVNITHTPPSIVQEDETDSAGKEATETGPSIAVTDDIGLIGTLTLVPSTFSTGSYGWKGSKRITVELQSGDTDAEGGREKVQVMLSINATVLGSKPTKGNKAKGRKGKKAVEEDEDENDDAEEKEVIDEHEDA